MDFFINNVIPLLFGSAIALSVWGFLHLDESDGDKKPHIDHMVDPDILELPHTHNRILRRKKPCHACIREYEIELGWFPAPPVKPKATGRGVGPEDDGYICS